MTSAVFDFKDIRARMLGNEKKQPECIRCDGSGWIEDYVVTRPPAFETCPLCFNPKGQPSP
jgi:hypothetical protein